MKIVLVFGIFPECINDRIYNNSMGNVQSAADTLQKAIIKGLNFNKSDFFLVNLPFIGSYPKRYKEKYIEDFDFELETNVNARNVGFNNLTGYKLFSRYYALKRYLLDFFSKSDPTQEYTILIYSIHTPFLHACVDIKKKFKNIRLVQIVPDLPEYMSSDTSMKRKLLMTFNGKILDNLYPNIDGYILLSKYMVERLPIQNKPWTVVEGIFDGEKQNQASQKSSSERIVLYTGTLARRYGILNLLEAFHQLTLSDIKLIICGGGDSIEEVKHYTQIDKRIEFKGILKHEDILKLQRQAHLLVNPRTPEGAFTKYSFPSKTMEYLASGTPTVMYELPGIPSEYYRYCYTFKQLGINEMTETLNEILHLPEEELRVMGENAREFILSQKNPQKQTEKILQLINNYVSF